jgi:hypothetical protein
MPRYLQTPSDFEPQGKGSQSYWYAKAELVEMQRRIKQIEEAKSPSFQHGTWLTRAEEAERMAKDALAGDMDGDFWATYEMLKKVNEDWPGPP